MFFLKRILLVQLFPILFCVRVVNSPWEPIHSADVAFLCVISLKSTENNPVLWQILERKIPVLQGASAARTDAEIAVCKKSAHGCIYAFKIAYWLSLWWCEKNACLHLQSWDWPGLPSTRTVTSWSESCEATAVARTGAQALRGEAESYVSPDNRSRSIWKASVLVPPIWHRLQSSALYSLSWLFSSSWSRGKCWWSTEWQKLLAEITPTAPSKWPQLRVAGSHWILKMGLSAVL